MKGEGKDQRIPVMMSSDFVLTIDIYRHRNMIATRAEAIRRLVAEGLKKEMPAPAGE